MIGLYVTAKFGVGPTSIRPTLRTSRENVASCNKKTGLSFRFEAT